METNLSSCYLQQSCRRRNTLRRKNKRIASAFNLVFALIVVLAPYNTTSYTLSSRWKSLYHHSAAYSTPTYHSTIDRHSSNLNNIRPPKEPLLYARHSNVDELYAVTPKQQIQRSDDTAKMYILPDRERRKQISAAFEGIETSAPPTHPTTITNLGEMVEHDESESQIVRKRTPRMAVNVMNPTTIRRSSTNGTKSSKEKPRKSRSSTMPGFSSADTVKQRAFRDSIRLIEERTGRKYIDTAEKKQQRRKVNGETMYKNSPSVPDSLVQFASEIHQEERISRKEEIELGEKTQEAIRLQHLFQSLEDRLGREPTDDEWCAAAGKINMAAIGQALEDGIEAKNKLVTSNLRMVQSVVNTYIRNGLSAQYNAGDLMQEGIMALIRAAEKFEPDRGWKFSTYAMYWVRASVKRSQIYQSRIIPVPQRLTENHKRLKRIERDMIAATGRRPSMKELGATVGMTEEQVNRCMTAMSQKCYSLDQEIQNTLKPGGGGDSRDTMIEIVESKACKVNALNDYDRYERTMLREDLVETLRRYLPPQEAEVLLARYGFTTGLGRDNNVNSNHNGLLPTPQTNGVNEKRSARSGTIGEDKPATIAELSRMFNVKPDKIRRMIDHSLKHLNGVGLDEWLAFERDLP